MKFRLSFTLLFAVASVTLLRASGNAEETPSAESPSSWAIGCLWLDNERVAYTESGGLHFKPSQLKTVSLAGDVKTLGSAPASLWGLARTDKGILIGCDYRGQLHRFDGDPVAVGQPVGWSRSVVYDSAAQQILCGSQDGKLSIVAAGDGSIVKSAEVHQGAVFEVLLDTKLSRVVSCGGDGKVNILNWPNLETQRTMATTPAGRTSVWTVLPLADGRIVSAGSDRRVTLWNASGEQVVSICGARDWITRLVALGPDQPVLAASMDGTITIIDVDNLHATGRMAAAESGIWDMKLSPDGRHIALATRKQGVQILTVADILANGKDVSGAVQKLQPPQPVTQ